MSGFDDARLVRGTGDLWTAATRAPFLDAVGDASLPADAFERWLVQDHLFVRGFTSFVSILTARAPRDVQRVAIQGLAALNDELDWFAANLKERKLDPEVPPDPVCRRYVDHLLASAYGKPVGVLLAIFFGVEVAYCVGWGRFEARGPYAQYIDRWTNPLFVEYVKALENLADAHRHPDQQEAFDEVMRLERDFWRMTWEG